jgi:hypothetical protein
LSVNLSAETEIRQIGSYLADVADDAVGGGAADVGLVLDFDGPADVIDCVKNFN